MKKIQPFTIGTKLSVPTDVKVPELEDTECPVSALGDRKVRASLNDKVPVSCGPSWGQSPDHSLSPVEGPQEDSAEEEWASVSPTTSCRSIRKIAICKSSELPRNYHHSESEPSQESTVKPSSSENESVADDWRSGDRPHISQDQLQIETWMKRKTTEPDCDCCDILAPPLQQRASEAKLSQQRDLRDLENSLIRLTTSLDLKQVPDKTQMVHDKQKRPAGQEQVSEKPGSGMDCETPWLKLPSLLKDHHQDLVLALEVSSFYQQADNIISAINGKRSSLSSANIHWISKDPEIQEIASKIRMLSESGSRLADLHPTLATRMTRKQAEVRESWAHLQESIRNLRAGVSSKPPVTSAKEASNPPTASTAPRCRREHDERNVMGKDIKEEQNRLRGFEFFSDPWCNRSLSPIEEASSRSHCSHSDSNCSKLDNITEKQEHYKESKGLMTEFTSLPSQDPKTLCGTGESTSMAGKSQSRFTNSVERPSGEQRIDLRTDVRTDVKQAWERDGRDTQEILGEVERLWKVLSSNRDKVNVDVVPANVEEHPSVHGAIRKTQGGPHTKADGEAAEEYDCGMLSRFLELLNLEDSFGNQSDPCCPWRGPSCGSRTPEMSVEVGEQRQSPRTSPLVHIDDQVPEELQNLVSSLTLRINQLLSRCAELSMDVLDLEMDRSALCNPDPSGLDCLQEQQEDLEVDYNVIELEVGEMERLATRLQILVPNQCNLVGEEVQATLQAWEEVGRSMMENRGRLAKFRQLQDYLESYLEMIAWTEETRSRIFSTGATPRWTETEALELDCKIEQKLKDFDKLAIAGEKLVEEGHNLADIIKERTEELQSMLVWIQAHWNAQKEQLSQKKRKAEEQMDRNQQLEGAGTSEDAKDSLCVKADMPTLVVREPCPAKSSLGSSICLILSFDEQAAGISQVHRQLSPGNQTMSSKQLPVIKQQHSQQSLGNQQQHSQQSLGNQQQHSQQSLSDQPHHSQQSLSNEQQHSQQALSDQQHHSQQLLGNQKQHSQQSLGDPQQCNQQSISNKQQHSQQSLSNNQEHRQQSPGNIQPDRQQSPGTDHIHSEHTPQNNRVVWQQSHDNNQQHKQQSPGDNQRNRQLSPGNNQVIWQPSPGNNQEQKPVSSAGSQKERQQSSSIHLERKPPSSVLTPTQPVITTTKILQPSDAPHPPNKSPGNKHQVEPGQVAEGTHRVSTYLHVTDSSKDTDGRSEAMTATRATEKDVTVVSVSSSSVSSTPFPSTSSPLSSIIPSRRDDLIQAKSQSQPSVSLTHPMKMQKSEERRHTAPRLDGFGRATVTSGRIIQRCNTWPIGGREKESDSNAVFQVFVEDNSPIKGSVRSHHSYILREALQKSVPTPDSPAQTVCSYLSLGSTLNINLPKYISTNLAPIIDPDSLKPEENEPPKTNCILSKFIISSKPTPTDTSVPNQSRLALVEMEQIIQSPPEEKSQIKSQAAPHRLDTVNKSASLAQSSSPTGSDECFHDTSHKMTGTATTQKTIPPSAEAPCIASDKERANEHTKTKQCAKDRNGSSSHVSQSSRYCVTSPHYTNTNSCTPPAPAANHTCLSVHTKVRDLNGHIYYRSRIRESSVGGRLDARGGPAPRKPGRVIVCAEEDCEVCQGGTASERAAQLNGSPEDRTDALHPDHSQFQEDEEELEGIWRGRGAMDATTDSVTEREERMSEGMSVKTDEELIAFALCGQQNW